MLIMRKRSHILKVEDHLLSLSFSTFLFFLVIFRPFLLFPLFFSLSLFIIIIIIKSKGTLQTLLETNAC